MGMWAFNSAGGGGPATLCIIIPLAGGLIVLAIVREAGRRARGRQLIDSWASENGVTLLSCQRRTFFRGPFFFSAERTLVYYLTVRDGQGRTRHAWAKIGGFFSAPISVRWET